MKKLHYRFTVCECVSVSFREDILVANINDLRPDRPGMFIPRSTIDTLCNSELTYDLSVVPGGGRGPTVGAP